MAVANHGDVQQAVWECQNSCLASFRRMVCRLTPMRKHSHDDPGGNRRCESWSESIVPRPDACTEGLWFRCVLHSLSINHLTTGRRGARVHHIGWTRDT
jgi:hypothetical protein